jgi:hypothetical protein
VKKTAKSTAESGFKVGEEVTMKAGPGWGRIHGKIRTIFWDATADEGKGAFIINLHDGNYGGSDLFEKRETRNEKRETAS